MSRQAKITFTVNADGSVYSAALPAPDSSYASVEGWTCAKCGGSAVAGSGRRIESHSVYASDGGCVACKTISGVIRVQVVDTLFGLEEDERIASMGVRIY